MIARSLSMRCAALAFVLFCANAIAQQPAGPLQATSSRVAEGTWSITSIASSVNELPDTPGGRIAEVAEAWVRSPDEVVFWGRLTTAKDKWALFSWKAGTIRTLAEEGDKVISKYAAPGMADQLNVYHKKGWHLPLDYWNGKIGYLVSRPGAFRQRPLVYTWDGSAIRRLIGYPDTIAIDGVNFRVGSVEVAGIGRNGDGLLRIFTDQPKKLYVLAVHDGTSLTPLTQNKPLGCPLFATETGYSYAFLVDGPTLVASPAMCDRNAPAVIQSITKSGTKRLVGVGDITPLGGIADVKPEDAPIGSSVAVFDVLRSDQFLGFAGVPFVFSGGTVHAVPRAYAPDAAGRGLVKGMRPDGPYILDGKLIDSIGPTSLMLGLQRRSFIPKAGEHVPADVGSQYRCDFYLFDGTSLRLLTSPDHLIDETSGSRRVGGDYPAILVYERFKEKDLGVLELSLKSPNEGLRPPLLFNVGPERTVSLADVIDWLGAGKAVVRQPDGLYLLQRQR